MSLEDKKKRILIIDGQGGGMGRQLTAALKASGVCAEITAVGTNALATSAMLKAGADQAATGENAVVVGCRRADLIIGPIGIVIADALLGEVTPAMAVAVGQSRAVKLLLPVNQCKNIVVGTQSMTLSKLVAETIAQLSALCGAEKTC